MFSLQTCDTGAGEETEVGYTGVPNSPDWDSDAASFSVLELQLPACKASDLSFLHDLPVLDLLIGCMSCSLDNSRALIGRVSAASPEPQACGSASCAPKGDMVSVPRLVGPEVPGPAKRHTEGTGSFVGIGDSEGRAVLSESVGLTAGPGSQLRRYRAHPKP